MPIETRWYDVEQTIIHNRIHGRYTLLDIMNAFENAEMLIGDKSVPDVFIWDFTDARGLPSGLSRLGPFISDHIFPDLHYHTFLIAPSRFIRILTWTLAILPEYRISIVESLDEMEAHIVRLHEELKHAD